MYFDTSSPSSNDLLSPGLLSSAGMVNSVWHQAVLLSWGELTIPFLSPRANSRLPNDLLLGIRRLNIDRHLTTAEALKQYTSGPVRENEASEPPAVPRFWKVLLGSRVLHTMVIGDFFGIKRDPDEFALFPLPLSVEMVLGYLAKCAKFLETPFMGMRRLIDQTPIQTMEEKLNGRGFGLLSLMTVVLTETDLREIERAFPSLRVLGFLPHALLGMDPQVACWKSTLRSIHLRLQLVPSSCNLVRRTWPNLSKISVPPIMIGGNDNSQAIKALLAGIGESGGRPLHELKLKILAPPAAQLNLVEEIGVVRNVSNLCLLLFGALFVNVSEFIQQVEGVVNLTADKTPVWRNLGSELSCSSLILSHLHGMESDPRDCLEEEVLFSVPIAEGLIPDRSTTVFFHVKRSFIPPDDYVDASALPDGGSESPAMNTMAVDIRVDKSHQHAVLSLNILCGFGLGIEGGADVLRASQEFSFVGEFFDSKRTRGTGHLLFARDPFCNVATRSLILLLKEASIRRVSLILSLCPTVVDGYLPKDLLNAWDTPGKRAFVRLAEEAGFVIETGNERAVLRDFIRSDQAPSCVNLQRKFRNAIAHTFVREDIPNHLLDLSLFRFFLLVVQENRILATDLIRCKNPRKAADMCKETIAAIRFLIRTFEGRLPPGFRFRPVSPPTANVEILRPILTAISMNLVLCHFQLRQVRRGLRVAASLLNEPHQQYLSVSQKAKLYFRIGLLHELSGKSQSAIVAYRRALEIEPMNNVIGSRLDKALKREQGE